MAASLVVEDGGGQRGSARSRRWRSVRASGRRCCGSTFASRTPPIQIAATANVTPPTQVELSTPATTTSTNVASRAAFPSHQFRQQQNREHDAGRGRDVLRHPGGLEQPAGEAGRRYDDRNRCPGCTSSSGRSDPVALTSSTSSAASLRPLSQIARPIISISEAKAAEPGQRGVRLPSADAEQQRQLGGAEVQQIVIDQPRRLPGLRRRTDCPAAARAGSSRRSSRPWSDRRSGAARYDRAIANLRQDREAGPSATMSGANPGPDRNAGAVLGVALRGLCRQSAIRATASDATVTIATVVRVNPISMNSGSVTALWTAQPSAGAIGHASERSGSTARATARPIDGPQDQRRGRGTRMTLVVDAIRACGSGRRNAGAGIAHPATQRLTSSRPSDATEPSRYKRGQSSSFEPELIRRVGVVVHTHAHGWTWIEINAMPGFGDCAPAGLP